MAATYSPAAKRNDRAGGDARRIIPHCALQSTLSGQPIQLSNCAWEHACGTREHPALDTLREWLDGTRWMTDCPRVDPLKR